MFAMNKRTNIYFPDAPGCVIEQSEDDGDIILECVADANPNDVTVSFDFFSYSKILNEGFRCQFLKFY